MVFDKAVIGIAGEGERAETQRVHRRQLQQPEIWLRRRQVGQVEGNQIMPQHDGRALGEVVEPRQSGEQTAAGMHQAPAGIRSNRRQGMNPVVLADFQIQGEEAWRKNRIHPDPLRLQARQALNLDVVCLLLRLNGSLICQTDACG